MVRKRFKNSHQDLRVVVDHRADFLDRQLCASIADDEDRATVGRRGVGFAELTIGEVRAQGAGEGEADAAVVCLTYESFGTVTLAIPAGVVAQGHVHTLCWP